MLVKKKLEFFPNCPQNSSNLKLNSKSRFESPRTQIYRYKITLSLLSHMVSDIKTKKIVKFFFFLSKIFRIQHCFREYPRNLPLKYLKFLLRVARSRNGELVEFNSCVAKGRILIVSLISHSPDKETCK